MMRSGATRSFALLASLFVAFTLVSTDFAEARRGGSFGSRGTRTFQTAPATRTAPAPTAPVERSMTPNTAPNAATRQPTMNQAQRPGFFNGFGGSLMRGLLIGGLFGMLMGYGFGGMAGALGFIMQLLLLGLLAAMAMRFFRSRAEPVPAGGASSGFGNTARPDFGRANREDASQGQPDRLGGFTVPGFGTSNSAPASQDIDLTQDDLDAFERLLGTVQEAYSREDNAALRRVTTPEIVSFFSEELAENAKNGHRNDVSGTRLIQADIAEAWREGDQDYATAAFLYESIDVMRDRKSGEIVSGMPEPSETTELWTFTRRKGEDWKLSAIQATGNA